MFSIGHDHGPQARTSFRGWWPACRSDGVANIRQVNELPQLLDRLAGQSAQLLNVAKAGAAVGLEQRTADNYVRLLEALFLVRKLPAWGRTLRARAAKAPKLHLVDSGLAAHLMGINAKKLERRDPAALAEFGHLLKTFVVGELLKQASRHDDVDRIGHWLTSDGTEVDPVIETFDGVIVARDTYLAAQFRRFSHRFGKRNEGKAGHLRGRAHHARQHLVDAHQQRRLPRAQNPTAMGFNAARPWR